MPKFEFALRTAETIREAGVVITDDFAQALTTIQEHSSIDEGDLLLIGVAGFPPVQYECVGLEERAEGWFPVWRPHGFLA